MIDYGKYIGIPYEHRGRSKSGLDCLGLIWLVLKDHGIEVADGDGNPYGSDWFRNDPERYLRGLLAHGQEAPLDQLQALDVVYFQMGRVPTHGGVMVDSQRFLHILEGRRSCVSRLHSMWRKRLAGARRVATWA